MPHFIPIFQTEPPAVYHHAGGESYLRTGYCNHCGACCKSGDPFTDDPNLPCSKLVTDHSGAHHCGGRDTELYNKGCNVWPTHPNHLRDYADCTYVFKRLS